MGSAAAYRSAMTKLRINSNLIISKTLSSSSCSAPKPIPPSPFLASSTKPKPTRYASIRIASVLASVESMMPLHSAIASARLQSNISVDSSRWSWLSQGLATPS